MFTKTASIKPAVKNGHHPAFAGKERAVSSFIPPVQTKLNIGKPGDQYEVEADQVADKVVNGGNFGNDTSFFQPSPSIQKKENQLHKREETAEIQEKPLAAGITPYVQLEQANEEALQQKCNSCETDSGAIQKGEGAETIQTKAKNEEQPIQAKTDTPKNFDSHIGNRIRNARGGGSPLSKPTKALMESRFGADFSAVKIYTNSTASVMNKDLGARAFTTGNDIFFNEGQFNATTKDGQTLLAHELTHTIQQGASVQAEPGLQKKESEVDMEELKKQLEESNIEQRAAFDPSEADKARIAAAKKGILAEQLANSQIVEVEPAVPEEVAVEAVPQGSRIAKPIPQKPDLVAPSSQKKKEDSPTKEENPSGGPPISDATGTSPEPAGPTADSSDATSTSNASSLESEGGETLKYLEQESAEVCNKGAKKAQKLADNESAHDTAGEKAGQTKVAVVPPEKEGQSRGNAGQVTSLEGAVPPQPNDQVIKDEMDLAISNAVPKEIKELNKFEAEKKAQVIGNKVLAGTKKQVGAIKGTYNEIEKAADPTESDTPVGLPSVEQAPNTANLNLGKGAVPTVPEEQTDLSHFEEEADGIYEKEGISQDMQKEFENVDSGDIAEANKEKIVLKEKVASEPENLQSFATTEQEKVESDLQNEENNVKTSMEGKRKNELNGAKTKQVKTKTDLEKKREAVTTWINTRYTTAKDFVTKKLGELETQALGKFDTGQKLHSKQFEQNVKRRVNAWKADRYSGFWGGVKWGKDKLFGIDHFKTIKNIFVTERATFVQAINLLILNINTENEKAIQLCKDEITKAKTAIQGFISKLGPKLVDVGKKAQEETTKKLAELDQHIEKEKKKLQQKLCDKKDEAIKAIDKKIEEMKSEMSGLVGKLGALLLYAAKKFFKWAISKIGGSADKIISILDKGAAVLKKLFTDPIGFFKNLVKAVGGGIKGFVTNIVTWLKKGLVGWLMGQMSDSGLKLPKKFDMKGIIFLGLQVAGLTWNVIRPQIVKGLGPKGEMIMTAAEKGVDIIKRVIKEGPIVLWEIIMEKAAEIKTKVMEGIRNWAITQIIKKMSVKLLSMLNPAGAILQAIILLYDVVMFFVDNWERILGFVKSVFDSIGAIASGAIGKAVGFIEKTLGKTIPMILSFAARFVGLAGIGKAIRKVIETIQKPFKKILVKMVKFLVKQAKKLFKKGKGKRKKDDKNVLKDKEVGEKLSFSAGGESHKIWIDTKNGIEIMVASTHMSIKDRITKWNKKVNDLPGDKKEKAKKLLKSASKLYESTKGKGKTAKKEIDQATKIPNPKEVGEATKADNAAEKEEKRLMHEISQLFEIFGDKTGIIDTFSSGIDKIHPSVRSIYVNEILSNNSRYENAETWKQMKDLFHQSSKLADFESRPLRKQHEFGGHTFKNQAKPALVSAMTSEGKTKQDLTPAADEDGYILNRVGVVHGATNAGKPAGKVKEKLQDELFYAKGESVATRALENYFKTSLNANAKHKEFEPVIKQTLINTPTDGKMTIIYGYANGPETFRVVVNEDNLPEQIQGDNLSYNDLGRGRLEGATRRGLNRSHLIADIIRGSGYKSSRNIVMASSQFNQITMKDKEDSISTRIHALGTVSSFGLRVSVKWATETEDVSISDIKTKITERLQTLQGKSGTRIDVEKGILQNLSQMSDSQIESKIESNINQIGQPRIMDVIYIVTKVKFDNGTETLSPTGITDHTGADMFFGTRRPK